MVDPELAQAGTHRLGVTHMTDNQAIDPRQDAARPRLSFSRSSHLAKATVWRTSIIDRM